MVYDINRSDHGSPSSDPPELSKEELEELIVVLTQNAKFQAQTHFYNETCWDLCVSKPGSKLDTKTSKCLSNCVERFIDTTLYITNRYFNMLVKSGAARM